MLKAQLAGPDAEGLISMSGNNVVLPGDNLTMWIDLSTRHLRKIQVTTFYKEDVAQLHATFQTLPSGLNYVAFAEATVPAKQLSVQVQNVDYHRPN